MDRAPDHDLSAVAERIYHLTEQTDRIRALREAGRVVRPGGVVFAAAISRFASLLDGLSREFLFEPACRSIVEQDLRDGQHRNPERRPHWFTTAYFHHPDELSAEATAAGLDCIEVVGVEGVAGWFRTLFRPLGGPIEPRRHPLCRSRGRVRAVATRASTHLLMVAKRAES